MHKRLEKFYAYALLVIFAGIVVHAPLSVWLGTVFPNDALLIKSWKEIIMLLLVPVAIWLVSQHKLWREFGRDIIFRLLIIYAALHLLILAIWWPGAAQASAGLAIDLRYVLFFGLVYTLIRIAPGYKKTVVKVGIAGAALVLGFAFLQLFLPADVLSHIGYNEHTIQPYLTVDKNPDFIRVNSTLRGPNPLGAYAASVLIIAAAFVLRQKKSLDDRKTLWLVCGLVFTAAAALWVSYSRSAQLAVIVGIIAVVVGAQIKKISRNVWIVGGTVVFLLLAGLVIGRNSTFISNVILHENPNGGSSISSNDGHASSLANGLHNMIHQPFGAGIGSTGSASLLGNNGVVIEDQYLFIAHEAGWLGLALYICIFGFIMWRLWSRRSDYLALGLFGAGVCLAVIGLLLPVWVDDTVSIVWWGLAAVAIAGKEQRGR